MTHSPDGSAPLLDHLEELRLRIIYSLVFLAVGAAIAWYWVPGIIALLKAPLLQTQLYQAGKVQLVATTLPEQLLMSFNISLWAGLALALPFILHQVWLFVAPGLYPQERRYAGPFIVGAGLSFALGALFCYAMILPPMVKFLVDFMQGTVSAVFSVGTYIGQIVTLLVCFGLCFELPIVLVLLTRMGLVNHALLGQWRRFAIIGCLVVAAFITPTPDPVNMFIAAAPLYLLYELGVVLSRIFQVKPQGAEALPETGHS